MVRELVKEGRCGSASEVVREGLRLVQEHEAGFAQLRKPRLFRGSFATAVARVRLKRLCSQTQR